MTGFKLNSRREGRGAVPLATVVCLILLALLMVVQVAHTHPIDRDSGHCGLCIAMHSAAPLAVAVALIQLIPLGTPVPVMVARAASRRRSPRLFIRPPPAR